MHPTQIKNGIDLTHQMVRWNDFVEIKRIQELDLIILPPTHHASPPLSQPQSNGITVRDSHQKEFCNTIASKADVDQTSKRPNLSPKVATLLLDMR
jgi:hypothetical protein